MCAINLLSFLMSAIMLVCKEHGPQQAEQKEERKQGQRAQHVDFVRLGSVGQQPFLFNFFSHFVSPVGVKACAPPPAD